MINNLSKGAGELICDEAVPYLLPIFHYLSNKDIELVFISSDEMRELNERTRGIAKATDVLSFPHDDSFLNEGFLGSIAINIDLAKELANSLNHSLEAEVSLLFIHATLHLLGYDHEKDSGEHRAKEAALIEQFNLPKSLIDRTLESI